MALQPTERKLKYQEPSHIIYKQLKQGSPLNTNATAQPLTLTTAPYLVGTKVQDPRSLVTEENPPGLLSPHWVFTAPKARVYSLRYIVMLFADPTKITSGGSPVYDTEVTRTTNTGAGTAHNHSATLSGNTASHDHSTGVFETPSVTVSGNTGNESAHVHTYAYPGQFYTSSRKFYSYLYYYNSATGVTTELVYNTNPNPDSSIMYQEGTIIYSIEGSLSTNIINVIPINGYIQGSLYMNAGDKLYFQVAHQFAAIPMGPSVTSAFNLNAYPSYFIDIQEVTGRT